MAEAADHIGTFIHYSPGSRVRYMEVLHSCWALHAEEHPGDEPGKLTDFRRAIKARGFGLTNRSKRPGPKPPILILDAAWNDPALAAEAEASRILAEINRAQRTNTPT
ncbi:hypothetical protein [Streptomyces sp. LN499]|uniref:hypothetical protein n=1 Tax=Streptomyces sp. LN499 TaxID=3112977 RepID=UPI0037136C24